jgi:hypothetical protein
VGASGDGLASTSPNRGGTMPAMDDQGYSIRELAKLGDASPDRIRRLSREQGHGHRRAGTSAEPRSPSPCRPRPSSPADPQIASRNSSSRKTSSRTDGAGS